MWLRRALVVSLLITGGTVVAAPAASADVSIQSPCSAGFFCAYDHGDFTVLLLMSADTISGKVDVVNDRLSSGDNQTMACWRGRNDLSFRPDETTHVWPPFTTAIASVNDKTDHFDHSCSF